ncbi:DUF2797 domain-containing protein [Kitasatospora purpeofusca]|uniref:DUF2797 domain-containing protein n=1 Tax=Kitasatospora purpeofusca TaxID=67352 RepID=UPI0030F11939
MSGTDGWVSTGLAWRDGRAVLSAVRGRRTHEREVVPGTGVGWRLGGPRRCIGALLAGRAERTPCPHRAAIAPDGGPVQCQPCQSVDRGLALARDRILDDGRTYRLYLAWFGEGLLKVGLTAEQRGTSRLLEQGALAWTFAARGALPAVRRAELTLSSAGLARERFKVRAKVEHWWEHGDAAHRRTVLTDARARAHDLLHGHDVEPLPDHPVVDQVGLFGLTGGAPAVYDAVEGLADGAVVAGRLRAPIGRHLLLDRPGGEPPLLLDTRLLTGWTLAPAPGRPPSGLSLVPRVRPEPPDTQEALF